MPLRKTLFPICLIISVLCLAVGVWIPGHWLGAMLALLMGPAWLLARKYPASPLPFVCLWGSVGFAVVGTLTASPPLLMMFASALALAIWDLLYLDSALGDQSIAEPTRRYENSHLQSLTLALGSGLIGILLGSFLKLQVPFLILILFVMFILFALDRVWGYIKNTGKP